MDQALRRGLLEVCVLKVLSRADSYGYQIIKDVAPIITISESTLYPILKRLELSNCLSVYSVEHNSRLRKYYRITDLGKARISEFLSEWQAVMEIYNWIKERENDDSE
ncbi:MAG: PadR family transcriptional regulator [Evtepia sp.]